MMRSGTYKTVGFLTIILCLSAFCYAETPDPNDLFSMSLNDLMNVPIIVTASRNTQAITQTSIAISTIAAEDIHYSGLTTIPEILRLAPGVDVQRLDRYRYIVGVRGLTGLFSDRTLVLINGRTAMNSVLGPPDWLNLPVLVEDIERIEILRGPGGAAWGANALTGIINIITKKPGDDLGSLFSTTINEYGDTYNHVRFAGTEDKWAWRISAGYENFEDSLATSDGNTEIGVPAPIVTFSDRDFARISRFDSEFSYTFNPDSILRFGAAYSSTDTGDSEIAGYFPRQDSRTNVTRLFARLERTFDETTTGYLQWFGTHTNAHMPHYVTRYNYFDHDLEGQINVELNDVHALSLGGNLRWTHFDPDSNPGDITGFAKNNYDEYWAGLFLIDRMKLSEKLSAEVQGRFDYYSETQCDWSLRTTALYALDDGNHTLRASASRGFRTASLAVREYRNSTLMGLFNTVAPPEELENETTYALEARYTGKLNENLILQLNSYYQRLDNVLGITNTPVGPAIFSASENLDGADTYGAECEITFKKDNYELSGWYAYNQFQNDNYLQIVRAQIPSQHKVGLSGRIRLEDNWTFNANYTYNNAIENVNAVLPYYVSDMFHRLDLSLAHRLSNNRGEIMFGVYDVLNKVQNVSYDVSNLTSHETPGRTFFARLQLRF